MSDEDRVREKESGPVERHRGAGGIAGKGVRPRPWAVLLAVLTLVCGSAGAGEAGVRVELDKLEDAGNACRDYLLVENASGIGFESLKLDLVMFDPDGIIADRLAVEAAPLPVGKTGLRVFDIPGLACAGMGRMLLNDVVACADATGPRSDCLGLLSTRTRARVEFIK